MVPVPCRVQLTSDPLAVQKFGNAFGKLGMSWRSVFEFVGVVWEASVVIEELRVLWLAGHEHLVTAIEELDGKRGREKGKKLA